MSCTYQVRFKKGADGLLGRVAYLGAGKWEVIVHQVDPQGKTIPESVEIYGPYLTEADARRKLIGIRDEESRNGWREAP